MDTWYIMKKVVGVIARKTAKSFVNMQENIEWNGDARSLSTTVCLVQNVDSLTTGRSNLITLITTAQKKESPLVARNSLVGYSINMW